MMRERLGLLWRLVRDDGSIWVSIDDDEMPYLRVLMDEVCGRDRFVASNVWQKRYSRDNRPAIGDVHEYVVVYAKDVDRFKKSRNRVPMGEEKEAVYRNPNNDAQGRWRPIPMTAQGYRPNQMYPITSPAGVVHSPPEGRCWSMIETEFMKLLAEGRIYFGKDGRSQPNVIRYLSEVEGVVPWTWWPHDEVGHTDEAKKEIHALFGKENAFDTPKPERLIQRILQIATSPRDWVLDSFVGSGTTAAVAHKMGRRWIVGESGEHCFSCCVPRLKKVVDGEDPGGITQSASWQGGGGFKFYRLAESLLVKDKQLSTPKKPVYIINPKYDATMLIRAICKIENFRYRKNDRWHGASSEHHFLYVPQSCSHNSIWTPWLQTSEMKTRCWSTALAESED
jgi:adenine-specific DNA-methyltransferase